jgi:molecular chaperone GrpE
LQEPAGEPVDLHTLVSHFIALRQEINLQTRAVRAQQEQGAEALQHLAEAVEQLQRRPAPAPTQVSPSADLLRPLLKTLIDVHDILSLSAREARRVQESVLPLLRELGENVPAPPEPVLPEVPFPDPAPASFLARLLGVKSTDESAWQAWAVKVRNAARQFCAECVSEQLRQRQQQQAQGLQRVAGLFDSLVTGYNMGLQRLERTLQGQGLEAIPAVGERFDPEMMEVVEAVPESGRPAGEVLEEIRRGYLWKGRIFRYAQVRVAR